MIGRYRRAMVGLALAGSLWAGDGVASPRTDETTRARAVELFQLGRQLKSEGRDAEACEKFQESLAWYRSPGTLLNLGNCQVDTGDLMEARSVFRLAAREAKKQPTGRKRNVWLAAAQSAVKDIEVRLSRLLLRQPGGGTLPQAWRVELDGKSVAVSPTQTVFQNSGQHRLKVTAPGREPYVRQFEVQEGEVLQVEIILRLSGIPSVARSPQLSSSDLKVVSTMTSAVDSVGSSSPNSESDGTLDGTSVDSAPSSSFLPGAVTVTGLAVALAGGVSGILSSLRTNNLRGQCPGDSCPDDEVTRAKDLATLANVLIGSGVLVTAVGGTWCLLSGDGSGSAAHGPPPLQLGCNATGGCRLQWSGSF